jgi:hypothetical protein
VGQHPAAAVDWGSLTGWYKTMIRPPHTFTFFPLFIYLYIKKKKKKKKAKPAMITAGYILGRAASFCLCSFFLFHFYLHLKNILCFKFFLNGFENKNVTKRGRLLYTCICNIWIKHLWPFFLKKKKKKNHFQKLLSEIPNER